MWCTLCFSTQGGIQELSLHHCWRFRAGFAFEGLPLFGFWPRGIFSPQSEHWRHPISKQVPWYDSTCFLQISWTCAWAVDPLVSLENIFSRFQNCRQIIKLIDVQSFQCQLKLWHFSFDLGFCWLAFIKANNHILIVLKICFIN